MALDLQSSELPWLRIAQEILDGKFSKADDSTIKSLTIGLRSINHPLCRQALAMIQKPEVPKASK